MKNTLKKGLTPVLLNQLNKKTISRGSHGSFKTGTCAMELVDWLDKSRQGRALGHPDDNPKCVASNLKSAIIEWNDSLGDQDRMRKLLLLPLIPELLDTNGTRRRTKKQNVATTRVLVNRFAPVLLEFIGCADRARVLREMYVADAGSRTATRIRKAAADVGNDAKVNISRVGQLPEDRRLGARFDAVLSAASELDTHYALYDLFAHWDVNTWKRNFNITDQLMANNKRHVSFVKELETWLQVAVLEACKVKEPKRSR